MTRRIPSTDTVALSISRLDVADYLDLRLETVSRTMTRLARSGAITLSSNRKITIRNRAVLIEQLN
jgi:CRP/FNR family transcriptional regulator